MKIKTRIGSIMYSLGLLSQTNILASFTVNKKENVLAQSSSWRYTSFRGSGGSLHDYFRRGD